MTLGARTVLQGVEIAIEQNEIVTVIGPNGSGKSTLLRTLLGMLVPRRGTVTRRDGLVVGYLPQRLALDPTMPMSVCRFLNLPHRARRADREAVLSRVGLPGFERRPMAALSGGEFQRALLARALVARPDILMLDEPTQGLDQTGAAAFYKLIDAVRGETGCAVLMVSHDLHVVMAASDRVVCLASGSVCCEGAPEHVASAPAYRSLFGEGTEGALALYRHHDHAHHLHGPHEDCS
ncbi:metal ABC transporter ATP-binding protein [Acuticoccus sp.]|uniref:metal ABC transporter ATP-binding protein n=1 Tax=Acuticoccus sp. TaxID=1904378 RepID=UPI003B52D8E4